MKKKKSSGSPASSVLIGLILSAVSAVLLWVAFPPVAFSWAAWFALVPLFVALLKFAPNRYAFGAYYALSLSLWLLLMELGIPAGYQLMYVVAVPFFIVVFLFTFWQKDLVTGNDARFFTAITAIGFVAFEYLRQNSAFGQFGSFGMSQFRHPEFIQIASMFGVSGTSLMILLVNCSIALLVANSKKIAPVKNQVIFSIIVALFLLCVNFYLFRQPYNQTGRVRAAAIQYGITPEKKLSDQKLERIRKMYIDEDEKGQTEAAMRDLLVPLTKKAAAQGAQLIVWPEDAIQIDPDRDPELSAGISALAKETGAMIVAPFIAPLPGKENEKNPEGVNGAVFYNYDGKKVFRYLKQHRISMFDMERGPVGKKTELLEAGDLGRIGYMICYDSDYTDIASKYAALGAEYFVNSSHDLAQFISNHHPYMLMFRGVEHRRSMVKSDIVNGALITDPKGRILADPQNGTQIAIADVPLCNDTTQFSSWSKVFGYGCVVLFPILLIAAGIEGKGKKS